MNLNIRLRFARWTNNMRTRALALIMAGTVPVSLIAVATPAQANSFSGYYITANSVGAQLFGTEVAIASAGGPATLASNQCFVLNRVVVQSYSNSNKPGLMQIGFMQTSPSCPLDDCGESTVPYHMYEYKQPGNYTYHRANLDQEGYSTTNTYAVAKYFNLADCKASWAVYWGIVRRTSIFVLGTSDNNFYDGASSNPDMETAGTESSSESAFAVKGTLGGGGAIFGYRSAIYQGGAGSWGTVTRSNVGGCSNDGHADFDSPNQNPYSVFRYERSGSPSC